MTTGRERTLVLVHGAGSGPEVFHAWPAAFPGTEIDAVDLHAGLDVARASMSDYAAQVVRRGASARGEIVLCGWSMGGLVAMMAAAEIGPAQLVLLEPSPPVEVQVSHPEVELRRGTFDPEEVYGAFPPEVAARPESQLARDERRRGISIARLPCPCLVVYGDEFAEERGRAVARLYGARQLHVPGSAHWDLVLDPSVAERVRDALDRARAT